MTIKLWGALGLLLVLIVVGVVLVMVPSPADAPTTEELSPLAARVTLDTPPAGSTVGSTFTISGKAPGNWYFEASFPVEVLSAGGEVVGRGIATAQSDWMTVEDVAYSASVSVDNYKGDATLKLMRDNPSGLPENDDSRSFSIHIQ